jgi:hypothetical protein
MRARDASTLECGAFNTAFFSFVDSLLAGGGRRLNKGKAQTKNKSGVTAPHSKLGGREASGTKESKAEKTRAAEKRRTPN